VYVNGDINEWNHRCGKFSCPGQFYEIAIDFGYDADVVRVVGGNAGATSQSALQESGIAGRRAGKGLAC
jgi:hypothetical protein